MTTETEERKVYRPWWLDCEPDEIGRCRRPGCEALLDIGFNGPIRHECCQCQDTGRMRVRLQRSDPQFGRAVMCSACWRGAA